MRNQETHKALRNIKPGISLKSLKDAPSNYKRPKGFDQIPDIMKEPKKRLAPKPVSYELFILKLCRILSSRFVFIELN